MDFFTIKDGHFTVHDDLNFSMGFIMNVEIVADITYTEEQEEPDMSPEYPSIEGIDASSVLPPSKPLEWRLVIAKSKYSEFCIVAYQFPYILEKGEFMPSSCICQHEMCTRLLFQSSSDKPLQKSRLREVFGSKEFRETITFKGYKFLCKTLFGEKYKDIWSESIDKCY